MDGQNGGNEPVNPQNPEGAGLPENNDTPASGGAIFSNPDLTIEKDAIPEKFSGADASDVADAPAPTATASGDASRVAAAFASTDASQNKSLVPSGANAVTQSTATGDIKLGKTPRRKRSKIPLIIIGIGVVAIIAIVVILLVTRKGGVAGNSQSNFEAYYKLVVEGPSDDSASTDEEEGENEESDETETDDGDGVNDILVIQDVDNDGNDSNDENDYMPIVATDEGGSGDEEEETWYFLRGDFTAVDNADHDAYIGDVRSAYQTYLGSLSAGESELKSESELYQGLLLAVIGASDMERIAQKTAELYLAQGKPAAEEYVDSQIVPVQDETANMVMISLVDYFENYIKMLEIYRSADCIETDGSINECEKEEVYSNANFAEYEENMNWAADLISDNLSAVKSDFKARTETLRAMNNGEEVVDEVLDEEVDE